MIRTAFAKAHQRLVGSDADEPCVKAGFAMKVFEMRIGLQKSILHRVFGVFAISCDIAGETEDLVFVAGD